MKHFFCDEFTTFYSIMLCILKDPVFATCYSFLQLHKLLFPKIFIDLDNCYYIYDSYYYLCYNI